MEGDTERVPLTDITIWKLEDQLADLMFDEHGELTDPVIPIPEHMQSEIGAAEVDIKAWDPLRMTVCTVKMPVAPHMVYEGKIYVMQHGATSRFTMAPVEVAYTPDEWVAVATFETTRDEQVMTMRELEIIEGETGGTDYVFAEFRTAQQAIMREKASVVAGDELLRTVEGEDEAMQAAKAIAEAEARIEELAQKSISGVADTYPKLAPMYQAILDSYLPMTHAVEKAWSRVVAARLDAVHTAMLRGAPSISEAEGQRLQKLLASVANL